MSPDQNRLEPAPAHIYVHVPFCGRRCSYCDFSIAVRREIPVARYIDAIKAELVTRRVGPHQDALTSLYFGGGTPSKLGVGISQLTNVISTFAGASARDISEVTVEANPEDITVALAKTWRDAGVNRVSLGGQSFDDSVLSWMHRTHTSDQIARAVSILNGEGISRLSLDLIYAVPESLNRDWGRDLEMAIDLAPGHLSLYGLTVEPKTPLGRWAARGTAVGPPEERYEAEFLEADRRLGAAGYRHYEVSNYAQPSQEAVHNSAYWSGASYLGLGPSAHGFDGTRRRWNARDYTKWLSAVEGGIDPKEGEELLGAPERATERVYLGLRTLAGLEATPLEWSMVGRWLDAGWAVREGDRLVLTPTGWLRLDALAAQLT